jgi:hypothetical protein
MGGESQRSSLTSFGASSAKAQCKGKPAYLQPNSQSMHRTIEGVYPAAENIEDRSAIGEEHNQNNVEKQTRTYLERISNSMYVPVEGLLAHSLNALNKEEGV